ncbi:MAG: metallophosphatase family protein [Paludibacter sp.]|nr:metallophosphatase family protein [Paludibacter sp.]
MKIGLLSDTHCFIDSHIYEHFVQCDEIWHAGDIGNLETANKLQQFKPLRAVYGNIDGYSLRQIFPKNLLFTVEGMCVLMTHIGGYPGHYEREIYPLIVENTPDIFICGHSHILKVMYDEKLKFLHINPGAAGKYGFHNVQTIIRFDIKDKKIDNLEVIEMSKDFQKELT